jgi:hypothetical protein
LIINELYAAFGFAWSLIERSKMGIRFENECGLDVQYLERSVSHLSESFFVYTFYYNNSESGNWTRFRSLFSQRMHRVAGKSPKEGLDKYFPKSATLR